MRIIHRLPRDASYLGSFQHGTNRSSSQSKHVSVRSSLVNTHGRHFFHFLFAKQPSQVRASRRGIVAVREAPFDQFASLLSVHPLSIRTERLLLPVLVSAMPAFECGRRRMSGGRRSGVQQHFRGRYHRQFRLQRSAGIAGKELFARLAVPVFLHLQQSH